MTESSTVYEHGMGSVARGHDMHASGKASGPRASRQRNERRKNVKFRTNRFKEYLRDVVTNSLCLIVIPTIETY